MTTTVTIHAHCADTKRVFVKITDKASQVDVESFILQDGEKADRVVFDDREITVREELK